MVVVEFVLASEVGAVQTVARVPVDVGPKDGQVITEFCFLHSSVITEKFASEFSFTVCEAKLS